LKKAYQDGDIGVDIVLKAKKDTSKLAMRMVTDKNGKRRKVWVKVTQDPKTKKQKETDFNSGDKVKAKHKDGTMKEGKLVSVSQNTKKDATGIAQIKFDDGTTAWRSMNSIEHSEGGREKKKKMTSMVGSNPITPRTKKKDKKTSTKKKEPKDDGFDRTTPAGKELKQLEDELASLKRDKMSPGLKKQIEKRIRQVKRDFNSINFSAKEAAKETAKKNKTQST